MQTLAQMVAALITVFEGERLTAYQDSGGVWTNGIGNTHNVVPGSVITHEQAVADFTRNQTSLLALLENRPVIEGAALASFGFNCGYGALKKVLAGQDTIDNPRHTTDRTGKVLAGLVARRRLELALIAAVKVEG